MMCVFLRAAPAVSSGAAGNGSVLPDMVTKRYAHILDEDRRILASEMEQQFYRQGGTAIQPAAEKVPAMDANALAALLISNPELPTKVLQSVRTANNGWCCQQPR